MMDRLDCLSINAPRPIIGGIQKIIETNEEQELNATITEEEEEQDEDDDDYYLYDEDPPPYDIAEKLKEINNALSREIIPQGYEERQRKVIFRENPVDFEIPPTPNCSSDDEDDGYGDSTETSDDLPDLTGANSEMEIKNSNRIENSQLKICNDLQQKMGVDLSQLLGQGRSPATSSPNSVAEEINFLFKCFTKLSLQNNPSQAIQTQIVETTNIPLVNESEPFLLNTQKLDERSAISAISLDMSNNSLEESPNNNHQNEDEPLKESNPDDIQNDPNPDDIQNNPNPDDIQNDPNPDDIQNDPNPDDIQNDPNSSKDNQSKSDVFVQTLNSTKGHLKAEEELKDIGEIRIPAESSINNTELSESPQLDQKDPEISNELLVEVPQTELLSYPPNYLRNPHKKVSSTHALLKWKRAMRQLHNVRQAKYGLVPQSGSVAPKSNAEIQIEIEKEALTDMIFSKNNTARPSSNKPSTDNKNSGQSKRKLLLTRSSASSPALFKEKKSTNFEETMVMASQGKFRMMKTEDFQSSASKLTANEPTFVKMGAGRPMTSAPRRPENKTKIIPINTHQIYQRNLVTNSVKSKSLTISQYNSPYRPHSVSWHKEERWEDKQRQHHLRGLSGTTFRLTLEQKAEKERKLKAIAQERQQKLERAKQEKLKRKQEVEIAFKDWLRCKQMQQPNSKTPTCEVEESKKNTNHIEKSSSPAFQDWLKRKKMQKLEELRIAEIKRKVDEKMLYIRKHEDNEKAFKTWLQTKSRENNISTLRRKSSAANHFGTMSKWRTDNYFANYR